MESISLSLRISLLVIRTDDLGYWDDNNWTQVNIYLSDPNEISRRIKKQLFFWLTWKVSPLKPRVRLKSKLNKLLGLQKAFITTLLNYQQNFALWKFRSCEFSPWRNFASANFRFDEISAKRNFASGDAKFRQDDSEISFDSTKIRERFAKFRRINLHL